MVRLRLIVSLVAVAIVISLALADSPTTAPTLANDAVVVPFELKRVILIQGKLNGKPASFIFDTGASSSVLTPENAKKYGIEAKGPFVTCSLSAGDAVANDQRAAIQDLRHLKGLKEEMKIDFTGILGYTYVSQFVTTFDFRKNQLTLVPKDSAGLLVEEKGSVLIPFTLNAIARVIFVQASINDAEPMNFLVDTGSEETFLTPATAEKLKIKGEKAQSALLGDYEKTVIDSINVGGLEGKKIPGLIVDPPQAKSLARIGQEYDGILGRSFFEKYRVTIDYRTRQIKLTPN